jgi:hypothetical protein
MEARQTDGSSYGQRYRVIAEYNTKGDGYFYLTTQEVDDSVNYRDRYSIAKAYTADSASNAYYLYDHSNGNWMIFRWNGQDGQPPWIWGSNNGRDFYVYDPANFSVTYANGAGYANQLQSFTEDDFTGGDHFIKAIRIRGTLDWLTRLVTCYNGGGTTTNEVIVGYSDHAERADRAEKSYYLESFTDDLYNTYGDSYKAFVAFDPNIDYFRLRVRDGYENKTDVNYADSSGNADNANYADSANYANSSNYANRAGSADGLQGMPLSTAAPTSPHGSNRVCIIRHFDSMQEAQDYSVSNPGVYCSYPLNARVLVTTG